MSPVGFEPTIPAGERPQTYALNRAATGSGLEDKKPTHYSLRGYKTDQDSSPVRGKSRLFSKTVQTGSGEYLASYSVGSGVLPRK